MVDLVDAGTALYQRSADHSVLTALEAGFIHIDCAEMYGNEASVGQAIKKFLSSPGISRDSLFVTTKLHALPSGRTVQDSIKESLRKLQIDYLDLYLIHTPVPHQGRIKEVWKQMEEVYREGLAKNIGVSNFRLKDFAEFIDSAEVVPVVNQVSSLLVMAGCCGSLMDNFQIEFNPYLLKATEPLLALHKKYSILTVSYGGLVPLSRKTGGPLDDIIPTIRERLSKDTGKQVSDGQVLLKWLKAHDALPIT